MEYEQADRYRYGVIETAEQLAGQATGACSGKQADQLDEMRAWLTWRIADGWEPSRVAGSSLRYDNAVRTLAVSALQLFEDEALDTIRARATPLIGR